MKTTNETHYNKSWETKNTGTLKRKPSKTRSKDLLKKLFLLKKAKMTGSLIGLIIRILEPRMTMGAPLVFRGGMRLKRRILMLRVRFLMPPGLLQTQVTSRKL